MLAIALLAVVWLPFRIRFAVRATAARRYLDAADDVDLFALRALARQPLRQLVAIDPSPTLAWRRGDVEVIRALAGLELRGRVYASWRDRSAAGGLRRHGDGAIDGRFRPRQSAG